MSDQERQQPTAINKLYMKGFKSFQRQTAIPFYDGMTAIVGSNGSGKSNIIDAMSFVMGKRSSKLRAEKMEQLIFNGGENRTPADEAIVRLHLDNESGCFDEFVEDDDSPDEVVIGRKVTRNGYSTYRFNATNCKRAKIDDVLDAAGIDPSGYHFIRQGKIKDIVNRTPVERRNIIDDISGISSYEQKKEKAMDELEDAQEQLGELEIKEEMKQERLDQLREEKEAAEEYRELEQKKQKLKYSILKMRQKELKNQMEQLGESEKEERIEELEERVDELDDKMEDIEDEIDELEDEMASDRDTSIVEEIERIKGKIERKKGEIENKQDKIEDIEGLLDDYEKLSGYQGKDRAVKRVLDMDKDDVYGTVGQLVHYDDRHAVAIETAMGGRIDNIVVEDRSTANECVNFLKRNNIGRATFLPLDKVSTRSRSGSSKRAAKKPGVVGFATDLVDYDSQYENAISHVLGDTLVAEDLESVKSAGRVRAVTLDGDIMRKGGSITGGKKKRSRSKRKSSSSSSINPEEKRKQKEQLEDEIEELKEEIGNLNQLLDEKREEQEQQSQVSEEHKEQKEQLKEEKEELRQERKEKAEELQRLRSKIQDVQKKRAKFEAELGNVEEDLEDYQDMDEDQVMEEDIANLRRKRTRTINKMNDLGNVNERAIEEFEEFKEEYEEFKERLDEIRDEKREIEQIIEDIEQRKKEKFMNTLGKVAEEFDRIFQDLFKGGEADLELEEEGNIDSG
ncbi:MAG: AAA family ATPase, partial [Candidatus Nanohaloarchaea archaeon]|nr:AAA family ATPase [Candidatus Nanohaloarchaea archaeon]